MQIVTQPRPTRKPVPICSERWQGCRRDHTLERSRLLPCADTGRRPFTGTIPAGHVQVTLALMQGGISRNGSWSRKQLRLLGVTKLRTGWKGKILGTTIPKRDADLFIALKDAHL